MRAHTTIAHMIVLRRRCLLLIVAVFYIATAQSARVEQRDDPSTTAPRTDHAVGAYDEGLRRVILIGGAGDPKEGDRDTVWSWSGTQWEIVTKDGPASRVNAAAAFDARRQRLVVAGGSRKSLDGAWKVVPDSWESDRTGWRQIADMPIRDHHSLVVDRGDGLLMFGGIPSDRSGPWPADTWQLRADAWSRVATDGPVARGRTALAYDSRRRQIVLFGGASAPEGSSQAQTFLGDTWIWNGQRWRKAADSGPKGRYAHGMVFDERAGVVLLYSGAAAHRDAPLQDMWQWDGEHWTEIPLTAPTPGYRYQPVMVYDRARARTVLYGGIGGAGDTWEWDGQRWQKIGS